MKTLLKISVVNIFVIVIAYFFQDIAQPDKPTEHIDSEIPFIIILWSGLALGLGYALRSLIIPFAPSLTRYKNLNQGIFCAVCMLFIGWSFMFLAHTFYYQRSDLVFSSNDVKELMDAYSHKKYDFYQITEFQLSNNLIAHDYTRYSKEKDLLCIVIPFLDLDQMPVRLWYTQRFDISKRPQEVDQDFANQYVEKSLDKKSTWFQPVHPDYGLYQKFASAARDIDMHVKGEESDRHFLVPIHYDPFEWRQTALLLASIVVAVMNLFLFIIFK